MGNKKFKNRSGEIPGQFVLDVKKGRLLYKLDYKERICTGTLSEHYWKALDEFIDASGEFSRAWNLYQAVKKELPVDTLKWQYSHTKGIGDDPEKQQEFHEKIRSAEEHRNALFRHGCSSKEDLYQKCHGLWNHFVSKRDVLLKISSEIGFPELSETGKRRLLQAFFKLESPFEAPMRREYYRTHYVNRALKEIKRNYYSEPISVSTIEKNYEADIDFQEHYRARKERKRAGDKSG